MQQKHALIIYFSAIVADLVVSYLFEYSVWIPYFSLAVLPALITYTASRTGVIVFSLQAIFLWLFAGINLGIAIFTIGFLAISIKDIVIHVFHTTTWQSVGASTAALLISLLLLGVLTNYFTKEPVLAPPFMIGTASTIILSFAFSILIKTRYA